MFRLVGIIVIFMFIFKAGRRMSPRVKDTTDKVLNKTKQKVNDIRNEFGSKRYYFETVTDEDGRRKRQVRAVEEIDREEYLNLKKEVE